MSEEEQVQQDTAETAEVEEETTEATEETETSEEATSEETEATEQEAENPELVKARKVAEDQRKRAEKAEAENKKLKSKPESDRAPNKDEQATALQDEIVRGRLEARGVLHEEDQEYVIQAAKVLGVHPTKAIDNPIVAAKLERMREGRKTKEATPSPSRRGGTSGTNDVGRLADKVVAGGELPKDPALAEKVQKELARRAQAAS